ncbi:carboxypeptidase-like regulatory domain-containing protein [uncultured Winogradskyella sp.]|uniref:carboxypeptidase-like regulatory domain-containing protein n=1 Tax=uncultured Winogradskyella sp. TaxID=395353 RepID=UPI0026392864|nr:carboxypeptidase-like regulatory domain-containing protein [uncultured Winogradskyella sp.]
MKKILLALFSLFTLMAFSQEVTRISVNGRIIVPTNDKEGVAVYNTSSNKGTATDKDGNFKIDVTVNDIIEFSALQFQDFSVTITEDVIKSKQLTVILVEEVNKLDEVVLLPFGLTGNLNADLENVRTYNVSLDYVYFGLDHIEDFEFSVDYKSEVENVAFNEYNPTVGNMLNIVNLAGFVVSQVVDIDKNKSLDEKGLKKTPFKEALDKYSINYIHSNFKIPLDQVEKFIDYVEVQGVDDELLKEDKEMQFLERITQLSESFLKLQGEKD